jgi:hypothetical protein
MTKSSLKSHGGRRKGAGRPRFTKTGKTEFFSTRITPKTREMLEVEAQRRGKSLSEVAEDLLQMGLEEIADLNTPKPLKALLFLISSLGQVAPGHLWPDPKYSWNANPYMFVAFRAAIIGLLDRLRPPGEVTTPPPAQITQVVTEEVDDNDDLSPWRFPFPDSPDEYARTLVLTLLRTALRQDVIEQGRTLGLENWGGLEGRPDLLRTHYGFVEAWRDLNLSTKLGRQK